MILKDGKPYIWTTWITGLLAGTDKCAWRPWVKSRYRYQKQAEGPESQARLTEWVKKHDAMVATRAQKFKAEGYEVLVEDQNSFKLEGQTATLAGKPDLVALRETERIVKINDQKSGKAKDQYLWQVLLYMLAGSLGRYKGWKISGEIEYADEFIVPVPGDALNQDAKMHIMKVLQRMGASEEPPRVPSKWECEYCDIIACPDRYTEVQPELVDATKIF